MVDSGKVAVFRLRPHGPLVWLALLILLVGGGIAFLLNRAADEPGSSAATLVLTVSVVAAGLCLVGATARFWFSHLHPHRNPRHGRRRASGARKR